MKVVKKGKETTIYIYGIIGEDVTDTGFIEALHNINSDILNVRINSPGGSVFAGNAIYNALTAFEGTVNTYIDGVAASMASVIALAGAKVFMAKNAMYMIHNPSAGFSRGNSKTLRDQADLLDKIKGTLLQAYIGKTGIDESELSEMLDKETWFTANEALERKFIDELIEPVLKTDKEPAAKKEFEIFAHYVPLDYKPLQEELINILELQAKTDENTILKEFQKRLKPKAPPVDVVASYVNQALLDKKIDTTQMRSLEKLIIADTESTFEFLKMKPSLPKITDKINIGAKAGRESWSLDDWRKNDPKALRDNPDFYQSLVDKEYPNN